MPTSKFSISAASRITGLSRPTIARHIKSGRISCELNDQGHKLIEGSELVRAYGDKCNFEREEKRGQTSETQRSELSPEEKIPHATAMQEQLIQRYAEENEHLRLSLSKALDYQESVVKLLEDRSKDDSRKWQATLDAMSEKLANATRQQIKEIELQHQKELSRLKRKIQNEANKSWLDKLLEKKRVGDGKRKQGYVKP